MAKLKQTRQRRIFISTFLILVISTAVIGALYFLFHKPTSEKAQPFFSRGESTPEILKPVTESATNEKSGNGPAQDMSSGLAGMNEDAVPPGMEQLKDELENGPPSKGPSIVKYAEKLTDKMGEAEENPAKVPEIFKELERCMRGEFHEEAEAAMQLPAVKAMCLFNAGELAQQYPEYKLRHHKLMESASQQVRDILKYTEGE